MTARPFVLARHSDPSGISGTGLVCEGVVWTGGCVTLHWLTDWPSVATFDSLEAVLAVHGHGGATIARFLDESPRDPETEPTTNGSLWESHDDPEMNR